MGKVYPESGYKVVSGTELLNAIAHLRQGDISVRALRVYLACFLVAAIREAAGRVRRTGNRAHPTRPVYRIAELSRATGLREAQVRADLRLLGSFNLVTFNDGQLSFNPKPHQMAEELCGLVRSPTRPVPIPRAVLRCLASERSGAILLVALAYMLRGLTIDRKSGELKGKGTAKASWISALTGLSERAVRSARAVLIKAGFISADTGSTQWKLNRDGAYFQINLNFCPTAKVSLSPEPNRHSSCGIKYAPRSGKKPSDFAPPYEDKKTSSNEESKNQKSFGPKNSGVFEKGGGEPKLTNVQACDLWSFSRAESLYFQACKQGLICPSEAAALNFLGAAVHARGVKRGDPVRIFCGILRKKLWAHVTQNDEEQARKALFRFRESDPDRFRFYRPNPQERIGPDSKA